MELYLPVFPLHTVLFPGTEIEIQIFEKRYRKLAQNVLQSGGLIGIFCIKKGIEAYGPLPEPYEYGTLGKILVSDPEYFLFDENFTFRIRVLGLKKIKLIHYYESSDNYLIGNVITGEEKHYDFSPHYEEKKEFFEEAKFYLKNTYFLTLHEQEMENVMLLCHKVLKYLNIPLEEKQKLLELSSFQERWEKTLFHLKTKNRILETLQKNTKPETKDSWN